MTKCMKCSKKAVMSGFCRQHFINYFENKVRKTIKKYKLADKNTKIAVAVSGGKDSTVLMYVLKKLGYKIEAMTVDANIGRYSTKNLKNLREFCEKYKIKLYEKDFKTEFGHSLAEIKKILDKKGLVRKYCMICSVLRRNTLNMTAKKMGFAYSATGHNLDDEMQSFLMNVLRNDNKKVYRLGPKSGVVDDKKFVPRIKPLYECREEEVKKYSKLMGFTIVYGKCPYSEKSLRNEFKEFLVSYQKNHPDVLYNMMQFFQSVIEPGKKDIKVKKIDACSICGEPTSGKVCKFCELTGEFK